MSREFKFRAKRVTDGVWVYGGLVMADDFCIIDQRNELYVEEEYKFRGDTHFFRLSGAMCDEGTVGQFTGLYDADGCEIYEGDIVKNESAGFFGVIKFKDSAFIIDIDKIKGTLFACLQTGLLEVVGNIHDNPELLEE